jgi:hypothetical protein
MMGGAFQNIVQRRCRLIRISVDLGRPRRSVRLGPPGSAISATSCFAFRAIAYRAAALGLKDGVLRRGVVSMTHAFGVAPGEASDYDRSGSAVSLLISTDRDFQSINAMARLSGIPVNISPSRRLGSGLNRGPCKIDRRLFGSCGTAPMSSCEHVLLSLRSEEPGDQYFNVFTSAGFVQFRITSRHNLG